MSSSPYASHAKKVTSGLSKKQFNWIQLVPVKSLTPNVKSHVYDWGTLADDGILATAETYTRYRYYLNQYVHEVYVNEEDGQQQRNTWVSYVNVSKPIHSSPHELWFGNRFSVSSEHVPVRAKYDYESRVTVHRVTNKPGTIVTEYVDDETRPTFTILFKNGVSQRDVETTLERWCSNG